jgi:hypothetical protein
MSKSLAYIYIQLTAYARRRMIDQLLQRMSTGSGEKKLTRVVERQEALESAFPMAFDTTKEWEPMEHEQNAYPNIKYWNELDFNYDEAAAATSAGNFPKKFRFLEDARGRIIAEQRLDDMRGRLLHGFEEIRLLMPSLLHTNGWLKCDEKLQATCYTEMRRAFPELTYCSRNWKARKLLIIWYSNYMKSRKKDESEGEDEVEITAVIPAKRSLATGPTKANRTRKRIKKEKGKEKARVLSDEDNSDVGRNFTQVIDPL